MLGKTRKDNLFFYMLYINSDFTNKVPETGRKGVEVEKKNLAMSK